MDHRIWVGGHRTELMEMLEGRERRVLRQQHLLCDSAADVLVSFTLNIAGPYKCFPLSRLAFSEGCREIRDTLSKDGRLLREEIDENSYGREAFFTAAGEALTVKQMLADIEERHPLGRLFDIDVLRKDGSKVSREELGLPPRRCLLCDAPAPECAGRRIHTVAELQEKTVRMIMEWLDSVIDDPERRAAWIGCCAETAMLQEVYTTPKPGLVDLNNTGSHRDMDVGTFERSAAALNFYFAECYSLGNRYGMESPEALFARLRAAGQRAEKAMFAATGGVNTHKGMIFSLGILCGALGREETCSGEMQRQNGFDRCSVGKNVPGAAHADAREGVRGKASFAERLLYAAGEIAAPSLQDFKKIRSDDTSGGRQFHDYGLMGIRGEAAAGFPSVRQIGLPAFGLAIRSGQTLQQAGIYTLLMLIAKVEDSNMIARAGREKQHALQMCVETLLREKNAPQIEDVEWLDTCFIAENASPGGCADLLALIYFLYLTGACFL